MSRAQTDNSHLEAKIKLRIKHLPPSQTLEVLDCFSGDGIIWNEIQKRLPERNFNVTRLEFKNDARGIYLKWDNRKILPIINLEKYDVIDLDAYGSPFDQLEIILNKRISPARYFCTSIFVMQNRINNELLNKLGFTSRMIKKCPSLISKNPFNKMKDYLALNGIRSISVVSFNNGKKNYFTFYH